MPEHMLSTLVVALLVLFTAVGVYLLVVRRDQQLRGRLAELAGLRGWRIEFAPSQAGRGDRIVVAPERDGDWSCTVVRYRNIGQGGVVRSTEFSAAIPATAPGFVLIGPPLPREEAMAAQMFMASAGAGWVGPLVERLVGCSDLPLEQLAWIEPDQAGAGTVFATADADIAAATTAHAALNAGGGAAVKPDAFPILILAPGSLKVRLRTDLVQAGRLDAFINHCLAAQARLIATD